MRKGYFDFRRHEDRLANVLNDYELQIAMENMNFVALSTILRISTTT